MATQLSHGPVEPAEHHWRDYFKFLWRALVAATDGSRLFYTWMFALSAVFLVGINAWAHQVAGGMVVTGMSDHVSWGLYIANFTFAVGLAAGGVMMVIPAYLYKDHDMHEVVIVGELLAIASIAIAIGFIMVDIGRPQRSRPRIRPPRRPASWQPIIDLPGSRGSIDLRSIDADCSRC